MSNSARVLTGLMERRALEAAFSELAATADLEQLVERAQAIAQHGSAAVAALVSLLDTDNPQLRGGLGQVAAHLDAEQIVPALRSAARARDRSDQARLTALMILDRYLHEPVDESMLTGLQDPDTVALQSLRELAHEMDRNQFVVIEYLNQLAEQPADVMRTVMDAIPRLPAGPHLVTLLRMLAQGEAQDLAHDAIEQLSRTRSSEAARALQSLALTLPLQSAGMAERGLRKLQMSGVTVPEQSCDGWRALISPVDGAGAQVVWFVCPGDGVAADDAGPEGSGTDRGMLLSILCKDPEGIVACFGSQAVAEADLPPAQPLGGRYTIQQTSDMPPILLLEAPFDMGRQVVRQALAFNWAGEQLPPMEYRLLNSLIWEAGPVLAADATADAVAEAGCYTPAQAAAVLDHPALASWFWHAPALYEVAEQLGRRHVLTERVALIEWVIGQHFDAELVASYQRRLEGMGRWLALAAEPEAAAVAYAAAGSLAQSSIASNRDGWAHNPFLRRLVGIGLDVAITNLRSGFDLRRHGSVLV
jgi:hypothetical protein